MSDAQKAMAESIIATLRRERWFIHDQSDPEYSNVIYHKAAHVLAAEIDKALGGLTREEQWVPVEQSGHRWQPRDQALALAALDLYGARGPMHAADIDSPVDRIDHESRWVSGWSEVQS